MIKSLYFLAARKLFYYSSIFKNLFSTNELKDITPASVMLICHDVDRGFLWKGVRYSQLIDSINDRLIELDIHTVSVSAPFSKKSNKNYRNALNINGLMARALLCRKLFSLFFKIYPDKNPTINAWGLLLEKINPKIIIGITPSAELCLAARARGIWIADLQHGILSSEGYYGLNYRKPFDQFGWPSCILCWNYESLAWVEKNVSSYVRALVIGNPWIIRFINILENDKLVSLMPIHSIPVSPSKLKILITLQWGPYFEQYHPTGLPGSLLELIKQSEEKYEWWIRIHPVILNDIGRDKIFKVLKKEFIDNSNIYWEHVSDLPLPQILAQIDLHVTLSSAVTIEAGWFGIPTALLGDNVSDLMAWFGSQIDVGNAEIVKAEYENISQWINRYEKIAENKSNFINIDKDLLDSFINRVYRSINSNTSIEELL